MLNFSKAISTELLEEVSKRFGKERIAVSLNDFDALFKQQHLIEALQYRDYIYASPGSEFRYKCYRNAVCCCHGYDG